MLKESIFVPFSASPCVLDQAVTWSRRPRGNRPRVGDVPNGTVLEIQNVLENAVIVLCRGQFGDIFSVETLNVARVVLWRYPGEGLRSLLNSFHRPLTSEQS